MILMLRFIKTGTTGVVQTFGRFTRLAKPGNQLYAPFFQTITPVSNRVCTKACKMQVRTKDKVFPTIDLAVQYQIKPDDTEHAFFSRNDPIGDMMSFIDNTVRSRASSLTLDDLYESQSDIAKAVMIEVGPSMSNTGYTLIGVQVRDVSPPDSVRDAMNDINASERRKIVAKNDGEALKMQEVMRAEADAIRKELQGKGLANMRDAIMNGWTESISKMSRELDMKESQVSAFMLNVLHLDTIGDIGRNDTTKTIFLNHNATYTDGSAGAGAISSSLTSNIRDAILQGTEGSTGSVVKK